MNGLAQLLRALVMESVAIALLFWLAFHQQLGGSPTPPTTSPPKLVIETAPAATSQWTRETMLTARRHAEGAARQVSENALRPPAELILKPGK